MPASTATCGNMDTASTAVSSKPRPLKLMRPSANDAVTPMNSEMHTTSTDTMIELTMWRPKGCSARVNSEM